MKYIMTKTCVLDDFNWLQMSWDLRGRLDALRLLAGRIDDEGRLTQNGSALTEKQIAVILRDDPKVMAEALALFRKQGILVKNGHGYEFPDWLNEQTAYYAKNRRKPAENGGDREEPAETGPTIPYPTQPYPTTPDHTQPDPTLPNQEQAPESGGDLPGRVGPADLPAEKLTAAQQERADRVMVILQAASVGKKKAFEASVYVATRINKGQYIEHVLAALAACYDDPEVKSPGIVAVTRILRNKVDPSYLLARSWRKVPPQVLEAAGIPNLDEYIVREFTA